MQTEDVEEEEEKKKKQLYLLKIQLQERSI